MRFKGTGKEATGIMRDVRMRHHQCTPTAHHVHTIPLSPFPNTQDATNQHRKQSAPCMHHIPNTKPTGTQTEPKPCRVHERHLTACPSYPPKHPSRSNFIQHPNQAVECSVHQTASKRDSTVPTLPWNSICHVRRVLEVRHAWTHESQLRKLYPDPRTGG
jgi:hypothetical protein